MDRYHPTVISGVSWYCDTVVLFPVEHFTDSGVHAPGGGLHLSLHAAVAFGVAVRVVGGDNGAVHLDLDIPQPEPDSGGEVPADVDPAPPEPPPKKGRKKE